MSPQTVTVPMLEANELSYEYDGRWDARYSKCECLLILINDGVSILGMNIRISVHSETVLLPSWPRSSHST